MRFSMSIRDSSNENHCVEEQNGCHYPARGDVKSENASFQLSPGKNIHSDFLPV